jgi:hypothetical protein
MVRILAVIAGRPRQTFMGCVRRKARCDPDETHDKLNQSGRLTAEAVIHECERTDKDQDPQVVIVVGFNKKWRGDSDSVLLLKKINN